MKPKSVVLNIPKPCHVRWSKMTIGDKGRFCLQCQKPVVNFTQMNDKEIVEFVGNLEEGFCGRFDKRQLNRKLEVYRQRRYRPVSSIAAVISALHVFTPGAKAQTTAKIEHSAPDNRNADTIDAIQQMKRYSTITGIIKDKNGSPLPGVTVVIDKSRIGATTNSDGSFKLLIPPTWKKDSVDLRISSLSYITQCFCLSLTKENGSTLV